MSWPGTLTQGGALFSLVPLVWESNPKLQGGWWLGWLVQANHQPIIRGSDPNHQGIWAGQGVRGKVGVQSRFRVCSLRESSRIAEVLKRSINL